MHVRLFLAALWFAASLPAQGQATMEMPGDSVSSGKKRRLEHEQVLIRLDMGSLFRWQNRFGWGGTARLGLEGKLSPRWSLLGELSTRYIFVDLDGGLPRLQAEAGGVTLVVAPRYYRKLTEGGRPSIRASGFSATYWTVEVSTPVIPLHGRVDGPLAYFVSDYVSLCPMMGFQQRLGRWGYMDSAIGVSVNYLDTDASVYGRWPLKPGWTWMPAVRLQLGLGVGG